MLRKKVVRAFIDYTDPWNKEFHNAIEEKVHQAYRQTFPDPESHNAEERDERIKNMREFYYARMTNTAVILLATFSVMVALIALLVSIFA
ncbi:hypothetical protein [Serratia marcescens]|uniref:hypothetical protein n=1 Tax=Serratia marcescens TaxID=615 RepID=UPI0037023690